MSNRNLLGCASVVALAAGGASAGPITLNFLELPPDESGIALTGFDFTGAPIIAPTLPGETYHVGVPFLGNNNPTPDFRLNHIGHSQQGGYLLVNILESDGTLSDQIFLYQDSGNNTHIDFISDPDPFSTLNPTGFTTETGALQFGLEYLSDDGTLVTVNFLSETDIPAPSAAALLGLSGLVMARRRRA